MAIDNIISGLPTVGASALKVAGLNLLLDWYGEFNVASLAPLASLSREIDTLRWQRILEVVENTEQFNLQFMDKLKDINSDVPQALTVPYPVLHSLGSDLELPLLEKNILLCGQPNIAFVDFVNTDFSSDILERLELFSKVVAFSSWGLEVLKNLGCDKAVSLPVGVDTSLFSPAPKAGLLKDAFVIFSAGDDAFAGGYDLLREAFDVFSDNHKDAFLLTSWSRNVQDVFRKRNIIELGSIPYAFIPYIIKEADVALFPNRCAYSNLWEVECMAMGIPTILSNNTAHKDIITPANSLVLGTQKSMDNDKYIGWSQSSVEEIIASLEFLYANKDKATKIGEKGRESVITRSWENYADEIKAMLI